MWFEQKIEKVRRLSDHFFPKSGNFEGTWKTIIQFTHPYNYGFGIAVDTGPPLKFYT